MTNTTFTSAATEVKTTAQNLTDKLAFPQIKTATQNLTSKLTMPPVLVQAEEQGKQAIQKAGEQSKQVIQKAGHQWNSLSKTRQNQITVASISMLAALAVTFTAVTIARFFQNH